MHTVPVAFTLSIEIAPFRSYFQIKEQRKDISSLIYSSSRELRHLRTHTHRQASTYPWPLFNDSLEVTTRLQHFDFPFRGDFFNDPHKNVNNTKCEIITMVLSILNECLFY